MIWGPTISLSIAALLMVASIGPVNAGEGSPPCQASDKRALVLSGGGFKGAFEAGAVYHLVVHRGCDFQDLSGVSAGALNASFLAQAPTGSDSQRRLAEQAQRLVAFWKSVTEESQIMTRRFGGLVGLAFGHDSLYDFGPLRRLISKEISIKALAASGRSLRVGTVSFWDGRYREITFPTNSPQSQEQFLDYVYASALIPLLGTMPQIKETSDQGNNSDEWSQFGDGGLRHNTPVAAFFDVQGVKPLELKGTLDVPKHSNAKELFVIVASPFKAASDELPRPPVDSPSSRHVRGAENIFRRTLDIALSAPYRWDLIYAQVLNDVLKWRAELYESISHARHEASSSETIDALEALLERVRSERFPVSSFNMSEEGGPTLPYGLAVISPGTFYETFKTSKEIIHKQLHEGCIEADRTMRDTFSLESMAERCDRELPEAVLPTEGAQ